MALQSDDDLANDIETAKGYLKRRHAIEADIAMLKEDLKQLDEEFKDKLDMKSLRIALSVAKAKSKVAHKWTFESFLDLLEREGWAD